MQAGAHRLWAQGKGLIISCCKVTYSLSYHFLYAFVSYLLDEYARVTARPAHWEKRPRVIQTSRGRVSEAEVSEHENALLRMRKSALAYATKKRTKDPFWKETNQLDKRTDRGSTCSIDVDCRSIKFGPSFFTPSGNRRRCQVYDGMLTDSCDSFSSNRLLDNSDNKKRNEDEYEIATSVPNTASTHAPKGNGKWNCVATRSRRCLDAPGNSDQRLQTKGVEIWSLASRLLLLRAQTEEGLRFRIHPFRFLRTKQVEDTDDSTNRHATKI